MIKYHFSYLLSFSQFLKCSWEKHKITIQSKAKLKSSCQKVQHMIIWHIFSIFEMISECIALFLKEYSMFFMCTRFLTQNKHIFGILSLEGATYHYCITWFFISYFGKTYWNIQIPILTNNLISPGSYSQCKASQISFRLRVNLEFSHQFVQFVCSLFRPIYLSSTNSNVLENRPLQENPM